MDEYDKSFLSRIMNQRSITSEQCWEFTGLLVNGRGQTVYHNEQWYVHRIIFKLLKPLEWNSDLQINHLCANKKCFNPDHMYCGTQSQNVIEAIEAGTHIASEKKSQTHCINGHLLAGDNVRIKKNGCRACRICQKEQDHYKYLIKKYQKPHLR